MLEENGGSVLILAARNSYKKIVEFLMKTEHEHVHGLSEFALQWTFENNRPDIAIMMYEIDNNLLGAFIRWAAYNGDVDSMYFGLQKQENMEQFALEGASLGGHIDIVKNLLDNYKFEKNDISNALYHSMWNCPGCLDVTILLLNMFNFTDKFDEWRTRNNCRQPNFDDEVLDNIFHKNEHKYRYIKKIPYYVGIWRIKNIFKDTPGLGEDFSKYFYKIAVY